jgi:hypothetical protein
MTKTHCGNFRHKVIVLNLRKAAQLKWLNCLIGFKKSKRQERGSVQWDLSLVVRIKKEFWSRQYPSLIFRHSFTGNNSLGFFSDRSKLELIKKEQ